MFLFIFNEDLQPTIKSLTAETNAAERVLNSLTALVDCRAVRAHYLAGARALCDAGLLGLALLLLASALAGLLFTILVWVDSHTWIYIRKKSVVVTFRRSRNASLAPH